MQQANADTVLGDFNNVTFKAEKETTVFSRKGDAFRVNTTPPRRLRRRATTKACG
jgi:hypothetical protein